MAKKRRQRIVTGTCRSAAYSARAMVKISHPPQPYVPITMQQAVDLARAKNPALLSAQQNLLSVKAQELQAGVRQNPNLVVTGSNVTLGEQSKNPYYYSVGVFACSNAAKSVVGASILHAPPQRRPTRSTMLRNSRPSSRSVRRLPTSSSPKQQKARRRQSNDSSTSSILAESVSRPAILPSWTLSVSICNWRSSNRMNRTRSPMRNRRACNSRCCSDTTSRA